VKPLLIVAGSSFGRLMSILAADCGRTVAGFVDDSLSGPEILGRTDDLGNFLEPRDYDLVLAVGYKHLNARLKLYTRLKNCGFNFPSLVHPTARISAHAELGEGCLVMAGADVDAFSRIGDACVFWPNATVSHDNRIGRNTFVSPAATLCGFVTIGEGSFIGANSTIVDGSELPDGSFVKASTRHQQKKIFHD